MALRQLPDHLPPALEALVLDGFVALAALPDPGIARCARLSVLPRARLPRARHGNFPVTRRCYK